MHTLQMQRLGVQERRASTCSFALLRFESEDPTLDGATLCPDLPLMDGRTAASAFVLHLIKAVILQDIQAPCDIRLVPEARAGSPGEGNAAPCFLEGLLAVDALEGTEDLDL